MSVEIPNGAVATYQGQWTVGFLSAFSTATSVVQAVQNELIGDGLIIQQVPNGLGFFDNVDYAFGSGKLSLTILIANQSGQELDDADLTSQVADAVAQGVGGTAIGSVTRVDSAGSGVNTGTGQTAAGNASDAAAKRNQGSPAAKHVCGDPSWGFFDDPSTWLQCLTTKGLTTVGLLAIGLLVGIVLLFATPQGAAVRRA